MKKKIIITIAILVGLIILGQGSVTNALISFLLVGAIPGTAITVPFWVMVCVWCLVITAVTTVYIETTMKVIRSQLHNDLRRARMPRRRYNQI